MEILPQIKRLGLEILDLVFPISCLVCGQEGSYLCGICFHKLPRLEKQKCIVCAKPSPFGKTHPNCVSRNTVDGMICALSYKDPRAKKIIETFKYNFVSDLSQPLARMIVETIDVQGLPGYFKNFAVIPVPLHQRRHNWRGFNQAELLSVELSKQLGSELDAGFVTRNKFTKPQTRLTAEERKTNIEHAFTITDEAADKKFLLVDDVVTSGSTANEIAKLLKQNKASEIWVASIAHG